jgi:hypothetical protein
VNAGNLDDKNRRRALGMLPAEIAYYAPTQAAGNPKNRSS